MHIDIVYYCMLKHDSIFVWILNFLGVFQLSVRLTFATFTVVMMH